MVVHPLEQASAKWREEERRRQEADLQTKKTRRLSVDLTDGQMKELADFAEQHNVTVNDILSNYVADLLGTFSNGSDERERARSYFDRTHLSWMYKDDPKWRARMERKGLYW